MGSTRDSIIEATRGLLELQGYYATGLNQIIERSGAPRGSLYHYFPEGKEELAAEAIRWAGLAILDRIRQSLAEVEDPAEAVRAFVLQLALHVNASSCRGGAPITAVALETSGSSDRLNRACRDAYHSWQGAVRDKLASGGYESERASRLATHVIATIEGAVVLARTDRDVEALERVAEELAGYLRWAKSDNKGREGRDG